MVKEATKQQVFYALKKNGNPSFAREVARTAGVAEATATKGLLELAAEGKVRLLRKGRFFLYSLA